MTHVQTLWATVLLSSLADAGVREVIISPGSRSTPLVAAAIQESRLRCRSLIDERAAAFFALGQARISGRPTLLICTSGTAVANYLPAVVEAGVDHIPLLILSADRPVELSQSGANQTIDQLKIFGDHARHFYDLGPAESSPRALRGLRRLAAQAAFQSLHPTPGAVHLNARLRKPLEPVDAPFQQGDEGASTNLARSPTRVAARARRPILMPDPEGVAALAATLRRCQRGLIVCGPAPIEQRRSTPKVLHLSRRLGYPVLAETPSQLRFRSVEASGHCIDAFDAILRSARFRAAHRPEVILQIGRSPTSSFWERYLEEQAGSVEHWVIGEHGWHDPQSTATDLLVADLDATLDALLSTLQVPEPERETSWRHSWAACETLAWQEIDAQLTRTATEKLSEGAVTRLALETLPEQSLLAVGNSLPVRQVDLWVRGKLADIEVWSQRGASGIDGLVSGVCGAASLAQRPTLLMIGDISFLHDLSGLIAVREVETPLIILVINNHGGRIFEQLPLASHPLATDPGLELWTTPHEVSFEAAAGVHGLDFTQVESREELQTALQSGWARQGVSLIEAVVPPSGAVAENSHVREAIRVAIGAHLEEV